MMLPPLILVEVSRAKSAKKQIEPTILLKRVFLDLKATLNSI